MSPVPVPNEDQIDAEIIVAIRGAALVIRSFVIANRLLEITNAFLRPFEEPTGAGHVCVYSAESEAGRAIAD